jgi:glutamine synthetase
VFETALAYRNAIRMADNAILFKFTAKSLGMKHGVMPSFMAKPWGNVGSYIIMCSLLQSSLSNAAPWMQWVRIHIDFRLIFVNDDYSRHIHVSLKTADGRNVFAVSDSEAKTGRQGAANDDVKCMSQEGEWFLGGVLEGLADGACLCCSIFDELE